MHDQDAKRGGERGVIRVLIIASSPVTRSGLETLLREDARFHAFSGSVADFVRAANFDVVLLEISGAGKLATFLRQLSTTDAPPTVLLADELGRADLRRALQAGIRAVLSRSASGAEILAALAAVANGLAVLTGEDLDSLLPAAHSVAEEFPREPLSSREISVLGMVAEGLANKEIATRLNISEHTVKFHVSSIIAKLGVTNRGEAVARGIREGLILI